MLNMSELWALYSTLVHLRQTPMSATGPRLERNDASVLAPGDYIILHRGASPLF